MNRAITNREQVSEDLTIAIPVIRRTEARDP